MQVERDGGAIRWYSGERVRNTWVTYPRVGNNQPKGWLIPHTIPARWWRKESAIEDSALVDGLMSYQLVGEVTAHQGFDG
jgi:hypothetical protein